jgi:hypothetical protein
MDQTMLESWMMLVAAVLAVRRIGWPRRATAWPGRGRALGVWGPYRGPQED